MGKNSLSNNKMYPVAGALIILIGFMINEFTIKFISKNETKFDSIEKSIILIFLQIIIILIGIYVWRNGKEAIKNLSLLIVTFIVLLVVLELVLSIPAFQCLSSDAPLWIPYKYKKMNHDIFNAHDLRSGHSQYGFNDFNHTCIKTDKESIRIAVLGDSFIYGDGVVDSVIWVNKLEKILRTNNYNCEIMSWGKSGWSTLDQYKFLREEGNKYEIDYLIFAFVVNDPVLDSSVHKQIFYQNGFIYRNIIDPFGKLFPNATSFGVDITNNFFSTYFDYGTTNWLKNNLYTSGNLKKYSTLLASIKRYCDEKKIRFSFILTPENHHPYLQKYFSQIEILLAKNKIEYLNLYPAIKTELGGYPLRQLWANPADGHPGNLVTSVIAKRIYKFLIQENLMVPVLK